MRDQYSALESLSKNQENIVKVIKDLAEGKK